MVRWVWVILHDTGVVGWLDPAEYNGDPPNPYPDPTLTVTQHDPDYHQILMVSSLAHVPPFYRIL